MKKINGNLYDEDVDYSQLEKREDKDYPDEEWYVCPICGNEYLPAFITTDENGTTMCIDCWSKNH